MSSWQALLNRVGEHNLLSGCRAIVAYNEVVDKVHIVSQRDIDELPEGSSRKPFAVIGNIADFALVLNQCLCRGTALETRAEDQIFSKLEHKYDFTNRIGGQAAIIGALISRFSGRGVVVHPDRVDNELGELLRDERIFVPSFEDGKLRLRRIHELDSGIRCERHLIFEFKEGLRSISGTSCPRQNRLIIDPVSRIQISADFEKSLQLLASDCDVFIAAGLDHMGEDYKDAFPRVASHADSIRRANPDAVLHLEITHMRETEKIRSLLEDVLPHFDSIGLNESELAILHSVATDREIPHDISPRYQAKALEYLTGLGPKRVHMHNLGYSLRAGRTKSVLGSIRSLAFGAAVVCTAASKGELPDPEDLIGMPLSPSRRGLRVAEELEDALIHSASGSDLADEEADGIICLPAPIAENPRMTVGLGDCISGASVCAEVMLDSI